MPIRPFVRIPLGGTPPAAFLPTALFLLPVLALLAAAPLGAQSYDPVGPQTAVDFATVTGGGWSLCFAQPYGHALGGWVPAIESGCTGEKLMLACYDSGSTDLDLLAAAPREEVLEDCGGQAADSHLANGAQWYHAHGGTGWGAYSWGFAAAGAAVLRDSCDLEVDGGEYRLCWRLDDQGGYRCGTDVDVQGPGSTKAVYRYTSAVFADGFETSSNPCRWSQASGTPVDCAQTATLALAPSCGATIVNQGIDDLDPAEWSIGFRFTWSEIARAWGYRLQVDYATVFEAEDGWVEVPAGTIETPIRTCLYPVDCSWTYRLVAHVGHWGGHGPDLVAGDLVSNECTVYVDWGPEP